MVLTPVRRLRSIRGGSRIEFYLLCEDGTNGGDEGGIPWGRSRREQVLFCSGSGYHRDVVRRLLLRRPRRRGRRAASAGFEVRLVYDLRTELLM